MARDLLFEIGCEDLPPLQIEGALRDMKRAFAERAEGARLEHGTIHTYGTPRRLAVFVEDVAERQEDLEETRVGPPAHVAYDDDGNPTRAAEGFARGHGVAVDDLKRVSEEKKGKTFERVAAVVREEGRPATELLPDLLAALPKDINWPKSMRWGRGPQPFARPVHWLLARFGEDVVDVEFAGVASGGTTRGHRFHAPDDVEVPTPADYLEILRERRVLADIDERTRKIDAMAREAVESVGGQLREDPDLLDEVAQLVEWPVPIVGRFDDDYLELPTEVLVTSMRKHQRYFSVIDGDGAPLPWFVTIANTEVRDPDVVAQGNLRVLRARLEDARFFYREDQKRDLDDWNDALERVTYVEGLGSVREKARRIADVARFVSETIEPDDTDLRAHVERAGHLCKADLVTGMVQEFPTLQGFIGGVYARNAGEPEPVATAIAEHYQPRGASDAVPESAAGAIVSIADSIDSIAALFSLGRIPTGTADPFALRRAGLGMLRIMLEKDIRLSLVDLVDDACTRVRHTADAQGTALELVGSRLRERMLGFILKRLRGLATSDFPTEVVDAVLALGEDLEDVPAALGRIEALAAIRNTPDFEPIAIAFKRAGNILGDDERPAAVDVELFESDAERTLHDVVDGVRETLAEQIDTRNFEGALDTLISLREPVDAFFEDVLVNAEDDAVRTNRHALLHEVLGLFSRFADVQRL